MRALALAPAFFVAVLIGLSTFTVSTLVITEAASAQVTPLDDETNDAPGLGSITGSPEAGPDPEDAGDRGGFAQLGVAIILLGGIGFIVSRVAQGARSSG